jgi:hypothetical protein
LVTRWIAYIRLFDFEVRHVPGNNYIVADGLSRRPCIESNDIDKANKVDIDDFIDVEINAFRITPITAEEAEDDLESTRNTPENAIQDLDQGEDLLEDGCSDKSWQIARYLTRLKRLEGLNKAEFRRLKKNALYFAVLEGNLYCRAGKNVPQWRVSIWTSAGLLSFWNCMMNVATKAGKALTDELQTGITRKTGMTTSGPSLQAVNDASTGIPTVLKRLFTRPGRAHYLRKSG